MPHELLRTSEWRNGRTSRAADGSTLPRGGAPYTPPEGRLLERIQPRSPASPGTPFSDAVTEAISYGLHHDARAQRPVMTERDIAERLRQLCSLADRLKMPSHRHSAESFMIDRDEIRDGLRRFHRELTGRWPDQDAGGPPRRAPVQVPTAVLRHRERTRAAAKTA